jgi:2,4-dienoyl-CoA reductase-like NADH-dependent reductase (Old Yellow Enzyme family)
MTSQEVEEAIESFVRAAVRAREAGFDAVQLHGAHGYLMTQFLSPLLNHRDDEGGGSPEKRRRFHRDDPQVWRAVGDFPLLMKLGVFDAARGMSLEEESTP